MFWCLVVIAIITWTVVYRFKRRRLYKLDALLPGSKTEIPIFGVTHKFIGSTQDILLTLQNFSYEAIRSKGIVKGWFNHLLYVFIAESEEATFLLRTCLEKDDIHRFLEDIIGDGSIYAPAIWRHRWKMLIPTFNTKNIEEFVQVFSEQSDKLAKNLNEYVNTGSFSVWPAVTTYTLGSVCETIMGVKTHGQCNHFLGSLSKLLDITCQRVFHIWLQPEWIFKLFPVYPEYIKHRKNLFAFIDEVIQKKRSEFQKQKLDQVDNSQQYCDVDRNKRKSFLDLLITLSGGEKGFNDLELREELLTLAIAATDTSAAVICTTLVLMAKYPKVQDKVFAELLEVFGRTERAVVKDDLLKLKYLKMVVKESMRLFPPVPFIVRRTYILSGHILPAGCGAIISVWGIHRHPKYWGPDAEHFDPERFLPERFKLIHPSCFLPFSNGPRNCIGVRFALMSMKSALTNILRRYKIVGEEESGPIPNIPAKFEILMKAIDRYKISLEKRK